MHAPLDIALALCLSFNNRLCKNMNKAWGKKRKKRKKKRKKAVIFICLSIELCIAKQHKLMGMNSH
jgi:hypothetical protein